MFCPTCGSNQNAEKRFCTSCGTNLSIVSQALTGQVNHQSNITPSAPNAIELERQRELSKGVRYAIIGGGILAFKLFSFISAGPFRGGSPFGFWSFFGFILLAIGISKIISHRPSAIVTPLTDSAPMPQTQANIYQSNIQPAPPRPVFSVTSSVDTSELKKKREPVPSVTEDDTQNLPDKSTWQNYRR